jgi:SAM-dependent methyltransferase
MRDMSFQQKADGYGTSAYDSIASLYDRWNTSVVEDLDFYVEEACASGGPVLELGVGTGRIAIPIARAGIVVIGVDSSALDLRLGDLRDPPVPEMVPLVISPFRAFLHLLSNDERLRTLERVHALLRPGGRLVFDVFAPSPEDIAETDGRWIEREPGILERADWNERTRTLVLRVRGAEGDTSMNLAWISVDEWKELIARAGFGLDACYGWFDRRPHEGHDDMIFVARRK